MLVILEMRRQRQGGQWELAGLAGLAESGAGRVTERCF